MTDQLPWSASAQAILEAGRRAVTNDGGVGLGKVVGERDEPPSARRCAPGGPRPRRGKGRDSAVANGRSSLPMGGDTTVTSWLPWVAAPLHGAGGGMGRRTDEGLQTLEPMDAQDVRRPGREKHASDASREREEERKREGGWRAKTMQCVVTVNAK